MKTCMWCRKAPIPNSSTLCDRCVSSEGFDEFTVCTSCRGRFAGARHYPRFPVAWSPDGEWICQPCNTKFASDRFLSLAGEFADELRRRTTILR